MKNIVKAIMSDGTFWHFVNGDPSKLIRPIKYFKSFYRSNNKFACLIDGNSNIWCTKEKLIEDSNIPVFHIVSNEEAFEMIKIYNEYLADLVIELSRHMKYLEEKRMEEYENPYC